jgi:hypothetical protein
MRESETDPLSSRTLAALREMPVATEAARARLRDTLAAERATSKRLIVLSRGWAVAAACAIFATASLTTFLVARRGADAGMPAADRTAVQFVLLAPDAKSVSIAGDFNAWDPNATPLARDGGGVWSVMVPLTRGAFSYSFVVDGHEWRADPVAPAATDDFGRPSSVVLVTPET